MDAYTHAAIKIQSVWRMWRIRRDYIYQDNDSHYSWDSWDAAEAEAEYKYHMYHCGGY